MEDAFILNVRTSRTARPSQGAVPEILEKRPALYQTEPPFAPEFPGLTLKLMVYLSDSVYDKNIMVFALNGRVEKAGQIGVHFVVLTGGKQLSRS